MDTARGPRMYFENRSPYLREEEQALKNGPFSTREGSLKLLVAAFSNTCYAVGVIVRQASSSAPLSRPRQLWSVKKAPLSLHAHEWSLIVEASRHHSCLWIQKGVRANRRRGLLSCDGGLNTVGNKMLQGYQHCNSKAHARGPHQLESHGYCRG
jgi:hypothetical protein